MGTVPLTVRPHLRELNQMEPRDLPLLLASGRFATEEEREPLDRIRMQKAVFLLEMQGPPSWRDSFEFNPFDWGPYSRHLTTTVNSLLADRLLEQTPVPHRRYSGYRTTEEGEVIVAQVLVTMSAPEVDFVRKVRWFVTTRSFRQLLRDVYAAYPNYAVASRFTG